MASERDLFSTEIVNRGIESTGPNAGSMTFSVRVRRRLPDFLQSVNLKYVKLGYHYLINHGIYLLTIPLLLVVFSAEVGSLSKEDLWKKLWQDASYDLATVLTSFGVFVFTFSVYFMSRPRPIYLIDYACYRPEDELKVSREQFIEVARKSGKFEEGSLEFQKRILMSSGIGDETYIPKAVISSTENTATMKEGRAEASMVMFGALDELFEKTRIRPKDIGVLVVNCSIFNPTPSLSAMIINHYKMRGNILSYNLGGMGCSAGIIAVDLARDILQSNPNNYAVVVSTEMVGFNWYQGKERSMLIPNCFFRMGCSALLLSNRRRDYSRGKYRLEHIVRTHKGADDRSFRCVYQEEDDQKFKGLKISKDLIEIGGDALKTNITTLGPLVLPFSEQLLFFGTLGWRHLFGSNKKSDGNNLASSKKPYIPDYKLAFEHFCVHAASKPILDELQRNLELSDRNMEASRMTLHRFGNTSSSSIWYELAYLEAKERVKKGDRIWQLAFGSGFKCNSVVWRAMRRATKGSRNNPWLDCINTYPVSLT
ncbi:hypothetical protein TanjilG_09871 [Lupinus angustifolius]|uniref:3-ketoacyl-CoA synthase n=1 Tax=Lupinus angustifolius TaxID=3871 RepID=A0A4P1QXA2_LUPAN|nr:PREDICTED: 3-ketoacyl-CoA synthase 10 [Lupinus angustifolius]OIV96444.1 hypothetical protein TanjilG_09871 [Lupinus angustifolius]